MSDPLTATQVTKLTTVLKELRSQLPDLMSKYEYNPDGSDYSCVFCRQRPERDDKEIEHDADCLGVQFQGILREVDHE